MGNVGRLDRKIFDVVDRPSGRQSSREGRAKQYRRRACAQVVAKANGWSVESYATET